MAEDWSLMAANDAEYSTEVNLITTMVAFADCILPSFFSGNISRTCSMSFAIR